MSWHELGSNFLQSPCSERISIQVEKGTLGSCGATSFLCEIVHILSVSIIASQQLMGEALDAVGGKYQNCDRLVEKTLQRWEQSQSICSTRRKKSEKSQNLALVRTSTSALVLTLVPLVSWSYCPTSTQEPWSPACHVLGRGLQVTSYCCCRNGFHSIKNVDNRAVAE